jgi:general secretion pathway protein B
LQGAIANSAATPPAQVAMPPAQGAAANPAMPPAPPAANPTTATTAAAPVKKFEDLSPALRQSLPRFTVGGAIYSDTPSARMLILNGQVFHEGDHPTPDTTLEQIKLKSAVMNYRGTRYEIAF